MIVTLTKELESLVQAKVRSGRYADASDVLRAALRRLEMDDDYESPALEAVLQEAKKGKIVGGGAAGYSVPVTDTPMTGIEKTLGVNGGDACIAGTRIPVWVLEEMRRQGATEAEILEDFPSLTPGQLAHAWACVKKQQAEIEAALTAHVEA